MNYKKQHIEVLLLACKKQDQKAQKGQAQVTGSGDIELYANEELEAKITGSGDIYCFGNPERQITKVTGSGDITIRN